MQAGALERIQLRITITKDVLTARIPTIARYKVVYVRIPVERVGIQREVVRSTVDGPGRRRENRVIRIRANRETDARTMQRCLN